MTILFISDLHLEAGKPEIGDQFLDFLASEALEARELYILGDLFEAWLGDDDPNPYYADMKSALRNVVEADIAVKFMHGNRDFMIGQEFAAETGVALLPDPLVIDLFGRRVLLSHGDALCTDDVHYQQVRAMTRNPEWQAMMMQKSLQERIAFAIEARQQSMARSETVSDEIMDVNQGAVEAIMREHAVDTMLHGHTHRPAGHEFELDGRAATRIVLGDWYEQGSIVRWDENGPRLEFMPRQDSLSET